jgi:A/G-specific adenine glycosylase
LRDHRATSPTDSDASELLLNWYDIHARVMPWRIAPQDRKKGCLPDPYHVWLSEVMLQQTTVAAVRDYFRRFVARWPTVLDLARAEDADVMAEWAGLGYYARARNLLKCARAVAALPDGRFPRTRDELLGLPGIGPYTAAAVSAIAFDQASPVVDGNVERVMARLFAVLEPLSKAKSTLVAHAASLTPARRPGDYAQAVMDLGATICTPRNPACAICPWSGICQASKDGIAASLPIKLAKPAKPQRQGTVWAVFRADGALLLELRPEKGLLGGMLGLPGDQWDGAGGAPPVDAKWVQAGEVRHVFTHFHLTLTVAVTLVDMEARPLRGSFVADYTPRALPTLMRKAHDLAAATRSSP